MAGRGLRVAITVESIPAFGVLLRPVQIISMANRMDDGKYYYYYCWAWVAKGGSWVDVCGWMDGWGMGGERNLEGSFRSRQAKIERDQTRPCQLPGLGAVSE